MFPDPFYYKFPKIAYWNSLYKIYPKLIPSSLIIVINLSEIYYTIYVIKFTTVKGQSIVSIQKNSLQNHSHPPCDHVYKCES